MPSESWLETSPCPNQDVYQHKRCNKQDKAHVVGASSTEQQITMAIQMAEMELLKLPRGNI